MNPKHEFIKILLEPIMDFFEQKLHISGMFVIVIIFLIGLPFIMKNKSKEYNVIVAKIIYCLALILGLFFSVKYTIDL